jgi:hypothetical protein
VIKFTFSHQKCTILINPIFPKTNSPKKLELNQKLSLFYKSLYLVITRGSASGSFSHKYRSRIRILPSSSKNSKKNKNLNFMTFYQRSVGSVCFGASQIRESKVRIRGSAHPDPDPYQNVTDPLTLLILYYFFLR